MKILLVGRVALLALLNAVLGAAVASTADAQLSHVGQLSAADRHARMALRGHPGHIVALQVAKAGRRAGRTAKRSRLQRLLHMQKQLSRRHQRIKLGICRGMKLKWWIKIKKKCQKAYGSDSKWDRKKLDGKCTEAWNACNTGFYAVCCTQPLGPKNLKAFCEKKGMTMVKDEDGHALYPNQEDKACEVQARVEGVHNIVEGIKGSIKLMDEDPFDEVEETLVLQPNVVVGGPSPGPMLMARGPAMAPPGIMSLAPAPAAIVAGPKEYADSRTKLEKRCDKLKELTREAADKIADIKAWAKKDGIGNVDDGDDRKQTGEQEIEKIITNDLQEGNPESAEAKDPDLVFSVQGVLKMGKKLECLLKMGDFCVKIKSEEKEDDDDPVEADLHKDPTKPWSSDWKDEEEDEEEEVEVAAPVVKVNETAIMGLLEWETDMQQATTKFETQVHPHGYKWWRYRYEYTVIESLVLALSVMVLYFTMWLLHLVSFSQIHKFYKTGLPQRFYRYAWVYLVFHAAALMCMVTIAYMLYTPWGKHNIFNWFAQTTHDFVGDDFNVPFLGYSWLYMCLDVQFQLFACFCLYSLFIVMVASNFITALREWKALGDEQDTPRGSTSANVALYRHFDSIVKRRVRNTPAYKQIFLDLKLRLPGVEGLDQQLPGWHDFKLHLYLTEGLGKSAEYLTEVSLTTNVFLAVSTLIVAYLAHTFELAFMYFLPGFVGLGFLIFVCGYAVSRYFLMLSDTDDHKVESKYVTVKGFCRSVQILLYCLFFSFSRLLLSNDIFESYTVIYISALIGLIVIMALLAVFAADVIKETTCALILPPHVSNAFLRKQLEQIVLWHTKEKCHECGTDQFAAHSSLSKEWAGKKPQGDRQVVPDSTRKYSWRG